MARPTIKIGVKFESSQEASKKLDTLIKGLEGSTKGLKFDLGLDTASKSFKEFSGILEKVQKQMQGMKLNVNMSGDPKASVRAVEGAIDQLQKKMTNFKMNGLLDEKAIANAQSKLNSINTDTPVKEIKKIKESFKELSQAENNIVKLQNQLNKLNLEKNKMNSSGTKSNAEVAYLKELENQIKLTESAMKKAKGGSPVDSKKITSDVNASNSALKQLRQEAQLTNTEMGKTGATFSSSFGQMAQMMGIFNLAYMGMNMLRNSFREGFEAAKQMDSAISTLKITMNGMVKEELQGMVTRSQNLATELSSTSNIVMEAVKTFANAQESMDSIFNKTSSAVILSNLTGLDIQTTVDTIQSATKQFDALGDGSAKSSMKVADSMVAISKSMSLDFSTGIKDFSESLNILGSLANEVGMDVDQTLGLIGTGMEKLRMSGSELATSMKTVISRMYRTKDGEANSAELLKTEEALKSINIEMYDQERNSRNFIDVMQELNGQWDNLTDKERMYIADAMGKQICPL